jgi:hypothetical protein
MDHELTTNRDIEPDHKFLIHRAHHPPLLSLQNYGPRLSSLFTIHFRVGRSSFSFHFDQSRTFGSFHATTTLWSTLKAIHSADRFCQVLFIKWKRGRTFHTQALPSACAKLCRSDQTTVATGNRNLATFILLGDHPAAARCGTKRKAAGRAKAQAVTVSHATEEPVITVTGIIGTDTTGGHALHHGREERCSFQREWKDTK